MKFIVAADTDVGIVKDRPFGKRFADKHSVPKN